MSKESIFFRIVNTTRMEPNVKCVCRAITVMPDEEHHMIVPPNQLAKKKADHAVIVDVERNSHQSQSRTEKKRVVHVEAKVNTSTISMWRLFEKELK